MSNGRSQLVQTLESGTYEELRDACKQLRSPSSDLTQTSLIRPLFYRLRDPKLPRDLLSYTLELLHRLGRKGCYAYPGATSPAINTHLSFVSDTLEQSQCVRAGEQDELAARQVRFYAALVLRTFAARYERATEYILQNIGNPSLSINLGQCRPESIGERTFLARDFHFEQLAQIYRGALQADEVRIGAGCMLAQLAYSKPDFVTLVSGLAEQLILERYQIVSQSMLRAIILAKKRRPHLVQTLHQALVEMQGAESSERLLREALDVV